MTGERINELKDIIILYCYKEIGKKALKKNKQNLRDWLVLPNNVNVMGFLET